MTKVPVGFTHHSVFLGDPATGQNLTDIGLDNGAHRRRILAFQCVLMAQHDRGDFHRLAIFIAQRQLRFGVGAQRGLLARFARLGQTAQDGMRILNGRRHQFGRLAAGIAKHDALVAGAVLVHPLGDMGRLLVQIVLHFQRVPVKLVLLVTNVLHAAADNVLNPLHHGLQGFLVRKPDFAAHNHASGGGKGFAGDPRVGLFGQEGIQHGVRNPVAQFVRMPFRDGLGSEGVVLSAHGDVLRL